MVNMNKVATIYRQIVRTPGAHNSPAEFYSKHFVAFDKLV